MSDGSHNAVTQRGAVRLKGLLIGVVGLLLAVTLGLLALGLIEDDGSKPTATAGAAGGGSGAGGGGSSATGGGSGAASGAGTGTGAADQVALVERGAYLARAGNCIGCHTVRGSEPYSGGRPVPTPFGTLYSTNLTSDPVHGLGAWSADDFWRALHNGKSRDGKLLYPAFPFTEYTLVTRADADAIYAFLKSLAPIERVNRDPELRFPFNQRWLLAFWRGLYFRAGSYNADSARDESWNRGAYLVQGLGHCGACHTPRNLLGASRRSQDMAGGLIPILEWYAPGLGGKADEPHELARILKVGVTDKGVIVGPMSEVVRNSLQHLTDADVAAISTYLQSLPTPALPDQLIDARKRPVSPLSIERGQKLYRERCADCHAEDGTGRAPAYPALAGNAALTREPSVNAVRMILNGGFAPGTTGNPRPYGMPPFAPVLDDQQVADIASYVRQAWGNQGGGVLSFEVNRYRTAPPD